MSNVKKTLKRFWKPDGKSISRANQDHLHQWMGKNGLSTRPGAMTVFIHSSVHQTARSHAVKALKIEQK
jgi:hypothetical protein